MIKRFIGILLILLLIIIAFDWSRQIGIPQATHTATTFWGNTTTPVLHWWHNLWGRSNDVTPQKTDIVKENESDFAPQDNLRPIVTTQEQIITRVIEKAIPAVVTVGINFKTRGQDSVYFDPSAEDGWGGFFRRQGEERIVEQNIGSGFVVSADGIVITNKHVVGAQNAKYNILLNDGRTLPVTKIYRDPLNDLAILKVDGTNLPYLHIGDSDNLKLGQTVVAIGTPLGEFTNSVTTGIVSGLKRGITAGSELAQDTEKIENVIQTDAAISPGNSGGPLLNSNAEVIGVNTAVAGGMAENIGFAIPANVVRTLLKEFDARGGTFDRPYIGIKYQMIDIKTALKYNLPSAGAYIEEVVPDSPAQKAGLEIEDIIVTIDGVSVTNTKEDFIVKTLLAKKVGEKIRIEFYRQDKKEEVVIQLEAYPQ